MKKRSLWMAGVLLLCLLIYLLFLGREKSGGANHKDYFSIRKKPTLSIAPISSGQEDTESVKHTKAYPCMLRNGYELLPEPEGLPKIDFSNVPKRISDATGHGATGKVTFRIVDSLGIPVPGAHVEGAFFNNDEPGHTVEAYSDNDGVATLENKCAGDLRFYISKDGYYQTDMRYWFLISGYDCVKDGRWLPWNPMVEVVLKEKRNPASMYAKRVKLKLPEKNIPFGFDCEKGDLVKPHGIGERTDLIFSYFLAVSPTDDWCFTNRLEIAVPLGGIQTMSMDNWSALRSAHEAPSAGFLDSMVFYVESTGRSQKKIGVFFTEDSYLCFRIDQTDSEKAGFANFGKIYPDDFYYGETGNGDVGGVVDFTYYYNFVSGNQSLEFDGRNLFKEVIRGVF